MITSISSVNLDKSTSYKSNRVSFNADKLPQKLPYVISENSEDFGFPLPSETEINPVTFGLKTLALGAVSYGVLGMLVGHPKSTWRKHPTDAGQILTKREKFKNFLYDVGDHANKNYNKVVNKLFKKDVPAEK
ncbi:MAG: hypothetical protein R3Y28_02610 [Candidatus Gastranaerophilales bacterium]